MTRRAIQLHKRIRRLAAPILAFVLALTLLPALPSVDSRLSPGVAFAEGAPTVKGNEAVRLRSAPWGAVVGELAPGPPLRVLLADCDADSQAWLKVSSAVPPRTEGWVRADLLDPGEGFLAEVAVGPLRLRDAAWGAPVATLDKGEFVRVMAASCDGDGIAWFRTRNGSWAYADFLKPEGAPLSPAADGLGWASVRGSWPATLRDAPAGSPAATILPGRGAAVLSSTVDRDGHWWHLVQYGPRRGWLDADHVAVSPLDGRGRQVAALLQGGSWGLLYAFEEQQLQRVMSVRTGAPWDPTPRGQFTALEFTPLVHTNLFRRRAGHEWLLPHFVQFQGHYGIHGPMLHEATRQPSFEETAGCLMPNADNARWLFNWLHPGDAITIR